MRHLLSIGPRGFSFVCAIGLAACGGSGGQAEDDGESTTTSGDEAAAAPEPARAATAAENMEHHFADVAAARNALIAGDLGGYRAPLERIAATAYGDDMPPDWQAWVAEMQNVAREGAQVESLEEAATAVAELGFRCGQCHRDTSSGPTVEEESAPEAPAGATPVEARMRAHAWGTEQLWLGLTAPSYSAWTRGAQAIADPGETRRTPMAASLASLQEYASRAALASRAQERTSMYADILARCASCHSTHGIQTAH